MIQGMNPYVRQAAKVLISKNGLTQTDIAQRIGSTKSNVSKALKGNLGQVPTVWQRINDEVNAEMVLLPKDKLESVIRSIYGDATWFEIQADLARNLELVVKPKEGGNN